MLLGELDQPQPAVVCPSPPETKGSSSTASILAQYADTELNAA
jgi:hypothetical protein